MKKTRLTLGAIAVAAAFVGAACAPPPAGGGGGGGGDLTSDTTNGDISCTLDIYDNGAYLFTSNSTYTVTMTLDTDDVAAGATADYSFDITGITNGPLPGAGGTSTAQVSIGGAAAVDSNDGTLDPHAANAPIETSPMTGTTGAINSPTTIQVEGMTFYAVGTNPNPGDDDWAEGTCTFPAAIQPQVTVSNI